MKAWPDSTSNDIYRRTGPVTAPTSKSAVRFIIRYVLRLRKCCFLAKAMIVKALTINTTINSVTKTASQMAFVWEKIFCHP